ncbi:ADP-ribose pyrophosphatase YjhB, NUDIX family [Paenibacillus sp. 1_12]|uniref:NUDIX hydrolase n=1 Tax=Paenibacillus sp. 1_12 TaxID=1566278 RepID=UPI0008E17361|nr:NUDIX hydrolase [Paenibacillus sp. 1_12]SFM29670.1 ADP-ribose pyrophosphatase YjhB, NUDIX family [Paenibacillus sp. 1_12]
MDGVADNFYRHMGVYGISVSNERLLVIGKILGPYTGKFDLPGGRLEKLESLEIAVKREFHEETGYTVKELKNIGVSDFFVLWTLKNNTVEHLHHIAILYEASVDSGEQVSSVQAFEEQDSSGALWMSLANLTPDNSSPLVLQAVEWIRSRTLPVVSGQFDYRKNC